MATELQKPLPPVLRGTNLMPLVVRDFIVVPKTKQSCAGCYFIDKGCSLINPSNTDPPVLWELDQLCGNCFKGHLYKLKNKVREGRRPKTIVRQRYSDWASVWDSDPIMMIKFLRGYSIHPLPMSETNKFLQQIHEHPHYPLSLTCPTCKTKLRFVAEMDRDWFGSLKYYHCRKCNEEFIS